MDVSLPQSPFRVLGSTYFNSMARTANTAWDPPERFDGHEPFQRLEPRRVLPQYPGPFVGCILLPQPGHLIGFSVVGSADHAQLLPSADLESGLDQPIAVGGEFCKWFDQHPLPSGSCKVQPPLCSPFKRRWLAQVDAQGLCPADPLRFSPSQSIQNLEVPGMITSGVCSPPSDA